MAILFVSGFDWTTNPLADLSTTFSGTHSGSSTGRYNGKSFNGSHSGPIFVNTAIVITCFSFNQVNLTNTEVASWDDGITKQVRLFSFGGILKLYDSSGTILLATGSRALKGGNWYWITWKVIIGNSGSSELYINGVLDHYATGIDTQGSIHAYCNTLQFRSASNNIDDLFVLDTTGGIWNNHLPDTHIFTSVPKFDIRDDWQTQYHGITVPHWSVLDEIPNDGNTSYIRTDTPGNMDVFSMIPNPSRDNVQLVQVNWIARKDASSTREIQLVTNGVNGDSFILDLQFKTYQQLFATEPFSGVNWTPVLTDNIQPGVRLIT